MYVALSLHGGELIVAQACTVYVLVMRYLISLCWVRYENRVIADFPMDRIVSVKLIVRRCH